MKTEPSRKPAFTPVEILKILILVAIIGALVAIAIPHFVKARETSQASASEISPVTPTNALPFGATRDYVRP